MLILVKLVENPLTDNKLQELTTVIYYGNAEHSIQQSTKFHTYSTNNSNIQINVDGWKYIQTSNMGGASVQIYRDKKNGYIHSQSTFTSLSSGSTTFNNMFPTSCIPKFTIALPTNYESGNNNKLLLQTGTASIMIHVNNTSAKSTHFGIIYPLQNP